LQEAVTLPVAMPQAWSQWLNTSKKCFTVLQSTNQCPVEWRSSEGRGEVDKLIERKKVSQLASIPSNDEVGRAVEYLIAYRLEVAKALLASAGLAISGTKAALRNRILKALADDVLSPFEIASRLDEVEGWGNQHILLYNSTESLAAKWQDASHARKQLKAANLEALLNSPRPIALPDEPTLSQVIWSEQSMRLVWVHGSQWEMRVPELDYPRSDGTEAPPQFAKVIAESDEPIIYKAYRIQPRRQICYFDWDLVTCEAALAMPRMPNDSDYDLLQAKLLADAERVLEVTSFEPVLLNKLIRNLEKTKEVIRRDVLLTTTQRTEINFRSADRKTDAYSDPAANDARKAISNRVSGTRGQFYWQPDGKALDRAIHMRVYPTKQRISIHDQCTEAEVRHVLSRVRHHCR
jgi:hypothetical protein